MYAYTWDLDERPLGAVADEVTGLGLDTITLATSYHAGKFLRPRGKTGKVYFPEDGTAYFRHDPARYGALQAGRKQHHGEARHPRRTLRARRRSRPRPGWC